eukprot:CAMPEP_0114456714 /NCGR_PEP_ID=MMETSP0104-20121206/3777_1 /TAXON_ID=37642 ORGANISM="Paraphysomonas imperforata, Strain PA2" /NCGR_SAMPLE_ID=MMETSP0104 /ASSEMBLY_ACC=CAM_ASM_000202 /LENGTH=812 /DNA_ID=CAMNT_0001629213 /DNA_START=163 /DNA_END=2601 /DNA_ORIENTATION=-
MTTGDVIASHFMEIGGTSADDVSWVTTSSTLSFTSPSVFVSLPTTEEKFSSSLTIRIRNKVVGGDGRVSFDTRVYQPNDTDCSKEWYTPEFLPNPLLLTWVVAEDGAYNFSNEFLFIGQDAISHPSESSSNYDNFKDIYYPTGCGPTLQQDMCMFPTDANVSLGTVAQLQTLVHNRFLLARALRVGVGFAKFMLSSHESTDPYYKVLEEEETLSYMAFRSSLALSCSGGGLLVESIAMQGVTAEPVQLSYKHPYELRPSVFGIISSYNGQNPVGMASFGGSVSSSYFMVLEDQCADEEIVHPNAEDITALIIGEVRGQTVTAEDCAIFFRSPYSYSPSLPPTPAPSVEGDTNSPTTAPSPAPTSQPSISLQPSPRPSPRPSRMPSVSPTTTPSALPSSVPSSLPTDVPTLMPSTAPTDIPTSSPTALPSMMPTPVPTVPGATNSPSAGPTTLPTAMPSFSPSFSPSAEPTLEPSYVPSSPPSVLPTVFPTESPSAAPSFTPTTLPSSSPSSPPTEAPTAMPSSPPTLTPTTTPSSLPTGMPTDTPSAFPTEIPTSSPTALPSVMPTPVPTVPGATNSPSAEPTTLPTAMPSPSPSFNPSSVSSSPTYLRSESPSQAPSTSSPSGQPSTFTAHPTHEPSPAPSAFPTRPGDTVSPTRRPSVAPSVPPRAAPTAAPSLTQAPSVLAANLNDEQAAVAASFHLIYILPMAFGFCCFCWILLTLGGATKGLYRVFFTNFTQVLGVEDDMSDCSQAGLLLGGCGTVSGSVEEDPAAAAAAGLWGVGTVGGGAGGCDNDDGVSELSMGSIDLVLRPSQ